jgi:quercetin dioxygenase-like cupin family protein
MRMRVAAAVVGFLAILFVGLQSAQAADDKMVYAAKATSKFVNLPGLPTCMTLSVQDGDPSKGASVILAKFTSGCIVPWHWHTATEHLMFVSGRGSGEMKGGSPVTLSAGDYLLLPGKSVHQFRCVSACTVFLSIDGAFDIHYVDADGKEIPPDQALKNKAKPAGASNKAGCEMKKAQ